MNSSGISIVFEEERNSSREGQWLCCPPSGVFLFPHCSCVPNIYLLINRTFCNSIKGSVMVYKVGNGVDPLGNPQSLDSYLALY